MEDHPNLPSLAQVICAESYSVNESCCSRVLAEFTIDAGKGNKRRGKSKPDRIGISSQDGYRWLLVSHKVGQMAIIGQAARI